jgi:hypothetical protein
MAPRLGVNEAGAKHPATSAPLRQGLGTNDTGAILLYLGAGDYGAKNKVHFLKSFRQGIFEIFFRKKGQKQKRWRERVCV